jgi:hypothetical protein
VNQAAAEFRRIAEEYCALVEVAPRADREDLHAALLDVLPRIYAGALALPYAKPEIDDLLPDRPTDDERTATYAGLKDVLGWLDYYRSVEPYPVESNEAPDVGSLADDLADIWRDVKQGLLALDAGTVEADVIWQWRHDFTSHWGRHAVDALAALHKVPRT